MGIPSYFSYIVNNYPHVLSKFNPNNLSQYATDNLYLDCNSILYDVYHALSKEDKIKGGEPTTNMPDRVIRGAIQKIHEYINLIEPKKTVYIAFDGVAPVAKIEQQRSRRYKSWYQSEVMKIIYDIKCEKEEWSTLAITPGTQFMSILDVQMHDAFPQKTILNQTDRTIILSSSKNAGEGEHKLFDYIRQNPEKHKIENTVIYGLDADLIVLSICHLDYAPNLFLFRESPHFQLKNLEPNANYLLNILLLSELIDINTHDYIVLTFMLGNDFLPHFPALNIRTGGMDKLMNAYQNLFTCNANAKKNGLQHDKKTTYLTTVVNGVSKIHWSNMRCFIAILADKEENYIQEEHKLRNRREFVFPEKTADERFKKFEATPTIERSLEKYIAPIHPGWQPRYYEGLFQRTYKINKTELIKDVVQNYCEGLEWTLQYYTHHCPDWRWTYKYSYPPLLQDLHKILTDTSNTTTTISSPILFNSNNKPVSELTQLCCVLPRAGLMYLPANLQSILLSEYAHLYQTDCCFLWAYCRYFWESHVVMEHINIDTLEHTTNAFENKMKIKQ